MLTIMLMFAQPRLPFRVAIEPDAFLLATAVDDDDAATVTSCVEN